MVVEAKADRSSAFAGGTTASGSRVDAGSGECEDEPGDQFLPTPTCRSLVAGPSASQRLRPLAIPG